MFATPPARRHAADLSAIRRRHIGNDLSRAELPLIDAPCINPGI